DLVKKSVKNYGDYYNKQSLKKDWPVTQSALDLSQIDLVASNVDKLGAALSKTLPDSMPMISDIREQVQCYDPDKDYIDYVDLFDLADLCKSNIQNQNVRTAAANVIDGLKNAVIAEIHL